MKSCHGSFLKFALKIFQSVLSLMSFFFVEFFHNRDWGPSNEASDLISHTSMTMMMTIGMLVQ